MRPSESDASIFIQPFDVGDFLFVVFINDFANDFFQYVFDGDQSGDTAVFIEDDRDMGAHLLEHLQQVGYRFRFRYKHRFAEKFLEWCPRIGITRG